MLNFVETAVPDIHNSDSPRVAKADKTFVPDDLSEIVISMAVLFGVVCCVFTPWLFAGKTFYWGDIGLFFLPLSHFLKDSLATGSIPLWNPYLYCGAPFVGNPQVSLLYPSTLLLPFLPSATAIMISDAVHIFAAGSFFWFFARKGSLKLSVTPALMAACTYMLGGYLVAKAQFPNMLAALSFVPLLLYQTELLVLAPSLRRAALFGAVLGAQLLAAHTQIVVFTLYLVVPYGVMVYFTANKRDNFFHVLLLATVGGLFAGGLSCGYWLPVDQLIHSTARQALTLHVANRFFLPWRETADIFLPHIYGSPMRGDFHAHGNYWEIDNFVGPIPALLALYFGYLVFSKKVDASAFGGQLWFWPIVFVVSVWLSLGANQGLYSIAFNFLPGLKAFHDPARLMLGANIALSLFAGAGLEAIQLRLPAPSRAVAAIGIVLAAVIVMGWHDRGIYPLKPLTSIAMMKNASIARFVANQEVAAGAGRILMPDSSRTWQSFTTYKSYEENDPHFLTEWPDTLSPDLGMTYSIREVGGYDPEYRRDSQDLVDLAEKPLNPQKSKLHLRRQTIPSKFASYLAILGIQYLVTYRIDPVIAPGLMPVLRSQWMRHERQVVVYRNEQYVGRASTYSEWVTVPSQAAALLEISGRLNAPLDTDRFVRPIVEKLPSPSGLVAEERFPAQFLVDRPDYVELKTRGNSETSLLVLADTLHPGWAVKVDGLPATIVRANVDQRGVFLIGDGRDTPHLVEFRYCPAVFLVGFYVTLISLAAILAIMIGSADRSCRIK